MKKQIFTIYLDYDIHTKQDVVAVDCLYGVKALAPGKAVLIKGDDVSVMTPPRPVLGAVAGWCEAPRRAPVPGRARVCPGPRPLPTGVGAHARQRPEQPV